MTAGTAPRPAPATPSIDEWPLQVDKPLSAAYDPFFGPAPQGWEDTAPGTPLRRRRVRLGLFGLIPVKLHAWQVLYRSTDLHGNPETTVTTVVVPQRATADSPLLAFQSAIDAVAPKRFPSYYLQQGSFGLTQSQNEFLLVVAALTKGWVVTISDHEGPHGLWMVARQPGYHVLDGLRATIAASGDDGIPQLSSRTPVAVWGYSGGGTATAWAAELAGEYAPELNMVGALIGAPAAQPGPLVHYHCARAASGLIIPVLAAMMRAHPPAREFLERHLNRRGRRIVEKSERMTLLETVLRWPFLDFNKIPGPPPRRSHGWAGDHRTHRRDDVGATDSDRTGVSVPPDTRSAVADSVHRSARRGLHRRRRSCHVSTRSRVRAHRVGSGRRLGRPRLAG